MPSISGLAPLQREEARSIAVGAAALGLRNAPAVHYTQGPQRWQGIAERLIARLGHFPTEADCSAFASWCLWNALSHQFGLGDLVNGQSWQGGFTGTMLQNGKQVVHETNILRGDLAIYGTGPPGEHVAICVGGGMVISHGSEAAPMKLPLHYRPDLFQVRRYI